MPSDAQISEIFFVCRKCGDCCRGYGGTYLTQDDITAIADYIKVDPSRFVSEYCELSGGKPLLGQREDGYCIFWKELCTIHPVKPRMCRTWPFIQSVLTDINNWQAMADSCPGIRTDIADKPLKKYIRQILLKNS